MFGVRLTRENDDDADATSATDADSDADIWVKLMRASMFIVHISSKKIFKKWANFVILYFQIRMINELLNP